MEEDIKDKLVEELAEVALNCCSSNKEYFEANIRYTLDKYEDHKIYKFSSDNMVDTYTGKQITENELKKLKKYTFVHIVD